MVLSLGFNSELGVFDLVSKNGRLDGGDSDIPTLFLTALFSNSVTTNQDVEWPGNSYATTPVGSRLCLLARGVYSGTGSILNQARDYANECLKPFLDLGIITSLAVSTAWSTSSGVPLLTISISAGIPNSTTPVLVTYGVNPNGTSIIVF